MLRWEIDEIGRDRLELKSVPVPEPGPKEVLVRVGAVALNYRDKMVIETGRGLPLKFPFTPGSDLAGKVVGVGEGVTRFAEGDRVISTFTPDWIDGLRQGNARTPAYRTLGGYYPGVLAEYIAMSEEWFVTAPTTLDMVHAATLPCAGVTAWFALVERAGVQAGDIVLIPSTGGVALFGLQIAKANGAEVIVSGKAANAERAIALGADHYIDSDREDWVEAVYELTNDRGADHVLEVIGGPHLAKSVQLAAVGGHICQIGALEGFDISAPAMPLMLKDVTIHGIGTGSRRALTRLVRAVDQAKIKPVVDSTYAFADLHAAFDHLDKGPFGKVVIAVSELGEI
ncbi:zinc-dependent alcohol dehydrogenase family protein [Rhizobium glycinendophyticum]|uniref:NAD(P)-dependent alcohol dehydrogenase n=1 Tax=Rhizobium glycinendophyticum TaxID=2589807 RepID=A0A504UI87_9HYPH|nr:NAD(P)-dependent alcohol dehydrogenase [Rhizobium glycinendophyticum]TPP05072.1 NAD(P)-dependent alcohol dehydrogenase [Rhizobium glycinendophyticum]